MAENTLLLRRLGLRDYQPVWHAMRDYTEQRDEHSSDELWLVQHPPIFTLGLNGKQEHLLHAGDIPVIAVDRGGQVTYHGPGQVVAYLLLDLRRHGWGVRQLVNAMEQAIINLLADYGISAEARSDAPGVYVNDAKIASLGLRIRQGRSYHGLSLNVAMELEPFQRINPCGYEGLQVTQLKQLGGPEELSQVENDLLNHLLQQLNYNGLRETAANI